VWIGRSEIASVGCMHGDRVDLINNYLINKFLSRERIRETTRKCKKSLFHSEMLLQVSILAYRWSHSGPEQARHEVGAPYPGTNRFRNVAGLKQQHVKRTQQHSRVGRPLARRAELSRYWIACTCIVAGRNRPQRLPARRIHVVESDTMYLLNSFRKSTPPQNRQLGILISNSKQ